MIYVPDYQTMAYVPGVFSEPDEAALQALIADHNFGLLIAAARGLPRVAHLPFLFVPDAGDFGRLKCHVARQNQIWRNIETTPVMAVFTGPHAYVSPDWYATDGLVPTWNYAAAYVSGDARVMTDGQLEAFLAELADREERRLGDKTPWSPDRVPPGDYAALREAIVGIDIEITNIEAKRKMSQNRAPADRAGVAAALRALDRPDSLAVAALIDAPAD